MNPPIITDIAEAARFIREGRIVAFPTGTSYGLAADPLQGHALQRLRNLKKRPEEKTFTVCLQPELWDDFFDISPEEQEFLTTHVSQPFTVLLSPKQSLQHISQDGRVGLRMIDHPLMAALAQAVQGPITATSANISGQPSCSDTVCIQTMFPGVLDSTADDIKRTGPTTYDLSLAAIIDGGTLEPNTQSTIIRYDGEYWTIIRQGAGVVQ